MQINKKLLFLFLIIHSFGFSQADSLKNIWNDHEQPDTVRIDALRKLVWQEYIYSSPDSAIYFGEILLKKSEQINDKKRMSTAYNTLGTGYYFLGDMETALTYYEEMGKLIDYYPSQAAEAVYLGSLANIYFYQEDYQRALDHYLKVANIFNETGQRGNEATTWNNIGNIYKDLDSLDKALESYKSSLEIREEIHDSIGLATTLSDIAKINFKQNRSKEALQNFHRSLSISEHINCDDCLANIYLNLAEYYHDQNRLDSSLFYGKKGYQISTDRNLTLRAKEASFQLYKIYKALGKYNQALNKHEEFLAIQDSIRNDEFEREVIQQELKYEFQKQAVEDSIKAAEEALVKDLELKAERAENKRIQQRSYFLYVGLGIALLFGVFIYNRFKISQKQKGIIESQKERVDLAYKQLEEKNHEILNSINYAKRIQSAILPPDSLVKQLLPQSFVLYLPKDIVAGDFYWLEQAKDEILFAAADCTGHGVPGAMISVLCNNALNRSVREHKLTDPGQILDKTREIVISEFEKSEREVKDGMDIALCAFKNGELKYAGAHNPLWLIRKDSNEVEEIKANKQPIGKFVKAQPYTTHHLNVASGDTVYLFSDGFIDQFGGEKGKKLKAKYFKRLLMAIHNYPMPQQKEMLLKAFSDWKGELEQIDDVCVIGVKF
ncbi:MAG: tetratricopeptide repeat protein [Flavobacteriales bacterium]|nr:tetratricopeptide repeat protein [Flavobacteriales bacterium]